MPHLVIYNLCPVDRTQEHLAEIERAVNTAITSISKLGLTDADISYSFVKDDSVESETIPIVVIVELLLDKPERKYQVRSAMAIVIGEALKMTIRKWRKEMPKTVEVMVRRFDPDADCLYCA